MSLVWDVIIDRTDIVGGNIRSTLTDRHLDSCGLIRRIYRHEERPKVIVIEREWDATFSDNRWKYDTSEMLSFPGIEWKDYVLIEDHNVPEITEDGCIRIHSKLKKGGYAGEFTIVPKQHPRMLDPSRIEGLPPQA